jgi:hypothetical protein
MHVSTITKKGKKVFFTVIQEKYYSSSVVSSRTESKHFIHINSGSCGKLNSSFILTE